MKHILVPTDGSEGSLKAVALAGELARSLDAKVTVLLVHDERSIVAEAWNAVLPEPGSAPGAGPAGDARASMEEHARTHQLAETRSSIGDVASGVELVQLWGHPSSEICRYAAEHDADLIVMGSHGRSALGRAILGSVSHAVVNSAGCAVTVVR